MLAGKLGIHLLPSGQECGSRGGDLSRQGTGKPAVPHILSSGNSRGKTPQAFRISPVAFMHRRPQPRSGAGPAGYLKRAPPGVLPLVPGERCVGVFLYLQRIVVIFQRLCGGFVENIALFKSKQLVPDKLINNIFFAAALNLDV